RVGAVDQALVRDRVDLHGLPRAHGEHRRSPRGQVAPHHGVGVRGDAGVDGLSGHPRATRREQRDENGAAALHGFLRFEIRAWIAAWRASRRSARTTTGTSIILPSTANDARPSALAFSLPSMMRFASATSSAEGEYSSLTMATCAGWMQVAPRK